MRIGTLGTWEILLILFVLLLFFGARRLPDMAKGISQSVREFRRGLKEDDSEATAEKAEESTT